MLINKKTGTKLPCWIAGVAVLAMTGTAYGSDRDDPLVVQGRVLYEETAGDVGCAMCHGRAGAGDPEVGGPYIRGASKAEMDSAMDGGVPDMDFIDLNLLEKQQVLAYLAYLTHAPEVTLDLSAAAGKVIFEKTAGGIGCQTCHGSDGSGDIGPDIRGQNAVAIVRQLQENEEMMFIELTADEISQVSDYLNYLHEQEGH